MWTLPRTKEKLPVYKQLVRHVEAAIGAGELAPGERLPAERTLARLLNVNRSTVIHALDELADRGVLVRKRGSGTYVNREKWGVQSYARINWQEPPALLPVRRDGPFQREAAIVREKAARGEAALYDLSRDDLAPDLLPAMSLPDRSWEEIVRAEQGDEAAHLGLASFRCSVARFLHREAGLSVPPDEILITSGSRQAIFLITQCLLKVGDAVGVEAPSYFYSLPVFQAAGLRLFALPMDSEGVVPEELEHIAERRSLKMIFLNPVFHNPTGTVMSDARKKAVLAFCAAKRIPIVEDDAYSFLSFGARGGLTPLKAGDKDSQVIYTGSLSSYAGRNVRAGWLVAPPGVIARLASARHMMDAGLSVLPQILAQEYLEHMACAHLPQLRRALAQRAEGLASALREMFGNALAFTSPPGGLYLYATAQRDKEYAPVQNEFLRRGIIPALGEDFGDTRPSFRLNHSLFMKSAGKTGELLQS
ncbi:PLP-dependent aminotransferase family protein [Desulfovibrio sp. OttesenSCG-928-O18]|nr:PLP-dependent aminotransferase family protein [Desulfovibrio sp. OttesenSCG-928-O18]